VVRSGGNRSSCGISMCCCEAGAAAEREKLIRLCSHLHTESNRHEM
jgi:hypothetical protein